MEPPASGSTASNRNNNIAQTARMQRLKIERERRRQNDVPSSSIESPMDEVFDGSHYSTSSAKVSSSSSASKPPSNLSSKQNSNTSLMSNTASASHLAVSTQQQTSSKSKEIESSNNSQSSSQTSEVHLQQQQQQQPPSLHPPLSKPQYSQHPNPVHAEISVKLNNPTNTSSTSGHSSQQTMSSVESPIPQTVQRALGDRSYEKRKSAAVEIEAIVKALAEPILTSVITSTNATYTVTPQNANCMPMIQSIIHVLSKEFVNSMNSNFRKGGLIGLAATAIALMVPPTFIQTQSPVMAMSTTTTAMTTGATMNLPTMANHSHATNSNGNISINSHNTSSNPISLIGNPSYNSALPKSSYTQMTPHSSTLVPNKEWNTMGGQIPNNFLVAHFLDLLLKPVLQCFDDPESRVRYYACESLYNIAKVARGAIFQSTLQTTTSSSSNTSTTSSTNLVTMTNGVSSSSSTVSNTSSSTTITSKRPFPLIFDGLTKLYADVDVDVKNGANLLDRLIKDIVTESCELSSSPNPNNITLPKSSSLFHVEEDFLPLLQTYIRRTNPSIRQLLVGWITALNSIPDISIIDYLPEFLDGLFNMLSDTNREIRQAADSVLGEFLREIQNSSVVQLGPIIGILTQHCTPSKDRLNRLTAISWLAEIIDHPTADYEVFVPLHADILTAFLSGISDVEPEIRKVSQNVCNHLMDMVGSKVISVDDNAVLYGKQLASLLTVLQKELVQKSDIPTKLATLGWIDMLVEKRREIYKFVSSLVPVLLKTLTDPSDDVVLLDLQVLSRIALLSPNFRIPSLRRNLLALARKEGAKSDTSGAEHHDDANFVLVINAIVTLFSTDRKLMENRGSLIVRKLCVLLNAQQVYIRIAAALTSFETKVDPSQESGDAEILDFISTTVQILNLLLLTAPELHSLRQMLRAGQASSGAVSESQAVTHLGGVSIGPKTTLAVPKNGKKGDGYSNVFCSLFRCWCHNYTAAFSLCLIAQRYDVAFALVKKFSDMDVTVGFLMQVDKLVHLLESPIFIHLRLQLLDVESPNHIYLLKSCYGLLMLLPQSDAFRSLNDRLTAVCNLRDNLGISPNEGTMLIAVQAGPDMTAKGQDASHDSFTSLLHRFDTVIAMHDAARRWKEFEVSSSDAPGNIKQRESYSSIGNGEAKSMI